MAKTSPREMGFSYLDLERAFDAVEENNDFTLLRKVLRRVITNINVFYLRTGRWEFKENSTGDLVLMEKRDGLWTDTGWKLTKTA